jgi:signal transduction histidine kinase
MYTIENYPGLANTPLLIVFLLLLVTLFLLIFVYMIWQSQKQLKALNIEIIAKNEKMQQIINTLEQSKEDNSNMMKIVAHDLRSPMAATISIAAMLLEDGNLNPEEKEMLELMKTSSLHSLEMVTDLLNMDTTSEELQKEPVEMHTLLQYCVNLLKFKASEKRQTIHLQAIPLMLNINREKMWRVISNLIINAIKFSKEGSAIDVQLSQMQNSVLLSVKDQGIGIPENLKHKIFNIFTDARRIGTSGEQTFGLGLAISRPIVEAHGGKIWFDSNEGVGTTFYIELPYK